jgi:hypothetical protein
MNGESRPEPVVYPHDHHARCARRKHRQQRGDALESGPVADAGRDRDHGGSSQPTDHTGERPFHPGHHDHGVGGLQQSGVGEEAVDAGYAHIGDKRGLEAERPQGGPAFMGHR